MDYDYWDNQKIEDDEDLEEVEEEEVQYRHQPATLRYIKRFVPN